MTPIILKLPRAWKGEIESLARRKGITQSKVIRLAIAKTYSLPEEQA